MRRLFVLAGIALVVPCAAVTAAQAAKQDNFRLEFPSTEANPCTGEFVDLNVKLHIVITSTVNRNNVSGTFHLNLSAQGVGQTTGTHYAGTEVDHDSFKGSLQNGQYTATSGVTFHLNAPKGRNNWVIIGMTHITVNANGDVTASFDRVSESCG
jgi:hypothetical protein